ncbi:MAG: peptidyl-prolyl cis-trans isomerase, partial [Deltaproteobacteria bacterium]|nr:peptidyl-prolyl cis-trans isomerase [Deltaproteobacteria bacterium]
ANRIEITAADVDRLQERWTKQWNRPPTETELKGMIEAHLREEVLYREALALGLDKNDTIIRRRLAQKMEFLAEDLANQVPPTDEELQEYLDQNPDRYRSPARFTFTQVYFSIDQRGAEAYKDAERLLAKLQNNTATPIRVADRGDRLMLDQDYVQSTELEVAKLFGQHFSEQLLEIQKGSWQGPIESGYGIHLVRIHDKVEPRLPELAEVLKRVQVDLESERRREMNKEIFEKLKARYEIVVAPYSNGAQVAKN